MSAEDVTALPGRIESLLDDLAATGDEQVAEAAEQLVASVAALYGAGLRRVVAALAAAEGGDALLRALAADDLVSSLLLVHDLHPDDCDSRIEQALERVRPYLGSHAGDVAYLGVDAAGIAHLRLEGSCHGCAGSAATAHTAIERAVLDAAPEVSGVDVQGVVEPTRSSPLLQIGMSCPDGLAEAARS